MMFTCKRLNLCYAFLLVYIIFQGCSFYFLTKSTNYGSSISSEILTIYKNLTIEINGGTKTDVSGKYKIFLLTQPSSENSISDVTLVSQCSSNHIHLIDKLCNIWSGPISVAVFDGVENVEKTLWKLAELLQCRKGKKLQLQLVLPVKSVYINDFNFGLKMVRLLEESMPCRFSEEISIKNYNRDLPYPTNLLRNVAKSSSSTDFIFIIDIDMVPSLKLDEYFQSFQNSNIHTNDKAVYVVPAFEVSYETSIPSNKRELIDLINKKICRPFYYVPCKNCQKLTQYTRWLMSNTASGTRVLYEVDWKHPWEPFFIARKNVPNHDERFKQYGMNRVSQICELHVAGYKFQVLDNVFLVHRGLKRLGEFHNTKNEEMDSNRKLYSRFKEELKYKYPESKGRC